MSTQKTRDEDHPFACEDCADFMTPKSRCWFGGVLVCPDCYDERVQRGHNR